MPPMEFAALMADQLPAALAPLVNGLLERKRAGDELSAGPRMPEISDFLEAAMSRLRTDVLVDGLPATPDMELLDALFRTTLHEVWG
jgi:predicted nucleotidyltransferase